MVLEEKWILLHDLVGLLWSQYKAAMGLSFLQRNRLRDRVYDRTRLLDPRLDDGLLLCQLQNGRTTTLRLKFD